METSALDVFDNNVRVVKELEESASLPEWRAFWQTKLVTLATAVDKDFGHLILMLKETKFLTKGFFESSTDKIVFIWAHSFNIDLA